LRHAKRWEVDFDGLEASEKESFRVFLGSRLGVDVVLSGSRVFVDSGRVSLEELRRLVNKFIYHRNLNRRFWVALDGEVVRVKLLEKVKKHERRRREATPPKTITHGW
jgi:hypothetical protein